MSRTENGGVVGVKNLSTLSYASGVFQLKSQFVANAGAAWPRSGSLFVGIVHTTSPYVSIYPFSSLGFGAKISDPGTLPAGQSNGIDFSPNGKFVAVAHNTTPYISVYPWSGSGFGSKVSDPAVLLPSAAGVAGQKVRFSNAGNVVALSNGAGTPNALYVYAWSSSGFGSKYSDPGTTIAITSGRKISFSSTDSDIVVGGSRTTLPFFYVFPWSSSTGFGTKYSDPTGFTIASPQNCNSIEFSPNGNWLAAAFDTGSTVSTTYLEQIFSFTSGIGFTGTVVNNGINPSSPNGQYSLDAKWHPTGNDVVYGRYLSPSIGAYPWTGSSFGTAYSSPATMPGGNGSYSTTFDPDGKYVAVANQTSPYIYIYPYTVGVGWGVKFSNPSTLPASGGWHVAWGRV